MRLRTLGILATTICFLSGCFPLYAYDYVHVRTQNGERVPGATLLVHVSYTYTVSANEVGEVTLPYETQSVTVSKPGFDSVDAAFDRELLNNLTVVLKPAAVNTPGPTSRP